MEAKPLFQKPGRMTNLGQTRSLLVMAMCIGISCLFFDDVRRINPFSATESEDSASFTYCAIQEKKTSLSFVEQTSNEFAMSFVSATFSGAIQHIYGVGSAWQPCVAGETDQSFSRIPIRTQHFASRCKPDGDSALLPVGVAKTAVLGNTDILLQPTAVNGFLKVLKIVFVTKTDDVFPTISLCPGRLALRGTTCFRYNITFDHPQQIRSEP